MQFKPHWDFLLQDPLPVVSIGHITQIMANILVEEMKRVSGASSLGLFQLSCKMLLSFR